MFCKDILRIHFTLQGIWQDFKSEYLQIHLKKLLFESFFSAGLAREIFCSSLCPLKGKKSSDFSFDKLKKLQRASTAELTAVSES